MATAGPHLTVAETCRRLGVSRKALRLYEAQGLIRPERTSADWRVYGPEQIKRLHQIVALKSFGFPLTRIAEILTGKVPNLAVFLEIQQQAVKRELAQLKRAGQLLTAARNRLADQGYLSTDDLIFLTRETVMTDKRSEGVSEIYEAIAAKHFSAGDWATLEANGYTGMDKPDLDWGRLHDDARRLMAIGDPGSIEAMDLAKRWMTKVFEATGGDPNLTRKVRDVAREAHEVPAFQNASSSSNDMMDFVQKAYGAAIEAGLMPKP